MLLDTYVNQLDFASYEDFYDNFRIRIPDDFNFAFDVVDRLAAEEPDRRALVWCDDKGGEAVFTFRQLSEMSNRAANYFYQAGIRKGDPVMLILKRRYEFWFAILGLHKLGAVTIPATHLLTKKDIVYRSNAADIRMIVAVNEPEILNHISEALPECPSLTQLVTLGTGPEGWDDFRDGLSSADPQFMRPSGDDAVRPDDMLLLYFTSGTTGMPKMVRHNVSYPLGHILTARYWQNVQDGGLHLTVADTGWAKAAWGKIYGQWLCGAAVFVYDFDKFVPRDLLRVVTHYGVTSFCAPPTIYRFFIKEDLSQYDFSALRYCAVAGEPLNPEVYQQFLKATGMKLMEGFGQTECTVTLATYPWMEPKPGSMGKPSPGYDVDIVDENGNSVDAGEEGQIVIRTDKRTPVGMFGGYYRDDALTCSVWRDGLYYTGDMAWRDEDGYFWFVGRADDVIKSSGYRIGPFEVESALLEHPAVLECAITGVPDPDRGQIIKATVVLTAPWREKAGPDLVKTLQEHVKHVTAPYKYPRVVEFVTELPKTISGKIRRVQIREDDNQKQ